MLAFHAMNTKRGRDDDSDSEDERYIRKSRPWPNIQTDLRWTAEHPLSTNAFSVYASQHQPPPTIPGLEAMTPAESDHSDANSPETVPGDDIDYAMQMDEDEPDTIASQPPDSPFVTNFRPAKLNIHVFNRDEAPDISNRVPTPMYPSFSNSSSSMSGPGYPTSGLAGGMAPTGNGFLGVPSSHPHSMQIPHRRQHSQDRTVRMPSPISEDEDTPDTPTAQTQSQLSRLSVTTSASDRMDTEMGLPAVTPTRGRKRSGALTGMGRFSMGYREDCEKCRLRVPGHYSHFL